MKTDSVYLGRISDSINKIQRATAGMSAEEFAQNEVVVASTILWLVQIGELAKKISQEKKDEIAVPWKQIMGFRDVAVHDYFDLSVRDVWMTVTTDIPALAKALQSNH